jgi:hypothetical protein
MLTYAIIFAAGFGVGAVISLRNGASVRKQVHKLEELIKKDIDGDGKIGDEKDSEG